MSEPRKPPPSNSSRTLAIIAVAVLIVVAIAGIVIAGRKAPAAPETTAATAPTTAATTATPAPPASTPQAAASPTDPLPKDVVFAAGSDKLPVGSNEPLARFADAARTSASSVRLSARFLTGKNKERDMELAKARTGSIRHALQANGVGAGKMQVELIEMPDGSLTPDAANRVDLTLR